MGSLENFGDNAQEVKNPLDSENLYENKEFVADKQVIIQETKQELLNLKNSFEVNYFLESNPKYKENKDYLPVIDFCIENKLNNEQILLILEAEWQVIKNRGDSESIFQVVKFLKDEGLLDSAGIVFEEEKEENINTNLNISESSESGENLAKKIIDIAKSKNGLVEGNKELNKMLGFDTKRIPWCAAFVNWCLAEAGLKGSGNNLALGFIGLSGYGHAGIKDGDKMISGNWGNKVAISKPMAQIAVGYAIPTKNGLKKYPGKIAYKDIPDGAIVCWRRNPKNGIGA